MKPAPLPIQFKEIVECTTEQVLPALQEADKYIRTINYLHGPAEEVRETLKSYDKSGTLRFKKYPLIVLIEPVVEQHGVGGYHSKANFSIGIAHHTRKDYRSTERYDKVINGVLLPLYNALLENIADSGYFAITHADNIKHTKKIRSDIGRKPFLNLEGMTFDYIDAIECDFELIRQFENCLNKNC